MTTTKVDTPTKPRRWKLSIYPSTTTPRPKPTTTTTPPPEFICPISGSLMSDPVILPTGHSFDRICITACKSLNFTPSFIHDFTTVIPNLALKSSILTWVKSSNFTPPKPINLKEALNLLKPLMVGSGESGAELTQCDSVEYHNEAPDIVKPGESGSGSELTRCDSGELMTRPSCCTSSESSEFECEGGDFDYVAKMRSGHVYEQEEGVVGLRKMTRSCVETRVTLCTSSLLSALNSLITSKYTDIQVNSLAALVNLSLENVNKVKIVRAGLVPPLIDVLRGRYPEAQEHACGALFSLALDDGNKTAIGVLGALQPLVHMMMRSESEGAKHDAALALYHLSLVKSNRIKLVKLGSVQLLLGMVKSGQMPGQALLILCNLGSCCDGRAAMLDAGAVEFLVELLRKGEFDFESTQESCVAALCAPSRGGGLRFRGLAKAAGAVDVLMDVAEHSSRERARDKARRVLEFLKAKEEDEEEEVDWEKVLEIGLPTQAESCKISTEF